MWCHVAACRRDPLAALGNGGCVRQLKKAVQSVISIHSTCTKLMVNIGSKENPLTVHSIATDQKDTNDQWE